YLPVVNLLKSYFEIRDRDSNEVIADKVTTKLFALDRALEPTRPGLLSLLDVSVDDLAWQGIDPPRRRRLMIDAVRNLLLREAQRQPLFLIVEDLHWIDSETQALLDSLVESVAKARILLLTDYRPEYHHGWSGKTCYNQIRLDGLAADGASELLASLLG